MAKTFPKQLFVKIGDGGTGPDFFDASDSKMAMVETGEKVKVAIYQLVGMEEVRGIIATQKIDLPKTHKSRSR